MTTPMTTETTIHTSAHASTHPHLHTHTLREAFTLLRGHSMPYEPVLAPTGVTSDSTSSASVDSGFRHYLRKVSSLDTPKQVISTVFIIPQNEVVSDQVFSENYDSVEVQEWKHSRSREYTSVDRTPLTDPFSATTMATATLTTSTVITNTESGFQDGGLSSSTISSSIESPRSTSVEHVEEEAKEVVRHLRHPSAHRLRSHIISRPRGSNTFVAWMQGVFRKKEPGDPKDGENSIPVDKRHFSGTIPPHEPRLKHSSVPSTKKELEMRVTRMRSIEVSALESFDTSTTTTEPTVHWTEYVTKVCNPASIETVLHTTCLQTTCEEASRVSFPHCEASNPPLLMRVGRVETASLPTALRSWVGSNSSSHQCISDLGSPTPRHVNWENKSTSPFTVLPTFVEDSGHEVIKQSSVRDRSYCHRNDSDSTRLCTRVYLDSESSCLQQSNGSMLIGSKSFNEPVNKKPLCRESQDENPPRSSQSTPICIARCQSFAASRSSISGSNDSGSFKVDDKVTVIRSQLDFDNGKHLLEDDENGLNYSPSDDYFVTKTIIRIPPSSTPENQQRSGGTEVRGKLVEESLPAVTRKISGLKTTLALNRSSLKLTNKTPPPAVCRRTRDIGNGVQSPLSPYPVEFKARRISSLERIATAPQTNAREDGIESCPQSRMNSVCRKSVGDRPSPLCDVDRAGDLLDRTGDVKASIDLTVSTLVNAAKEGISGNHVNMRSDAVHRTHTNSTPVKSRSGTQALPEKDKNLNSKIGIITSPLQQIVNDHPVNTNEKRCVSPTFASKPVAKVLPSTTQRGCQFIEGNKTQPKSLAESGASNISSKVNGTKNEQPQRQVTKKEADGELSVSAKANGLPKAAREVLSLERTSNSKIRQLPSSAVNEIEIFPSSGTHSSAVLVPIGPENAFAQIAPPTNQESQIQTAETRRNPPQISSDSTFQVALQNGNPRAPQSEASSTSSHPKTLVSRPAQAMPKQQESLNEAPILRDSATASTQSSRPSALQSIDSDKVPPVGQRNQTTPTSSTGQHFFPKTHQPPHSSNGTISANHGRGTGKEVEGLQEGTLKTSRSPTPTPSMKSTKIKRNPPVTKRPQTAYTFRTHESEGTFFTLPADTHKDAKPEDHFTIYEDIGKGKFGKVVRCENKQTHKIMAMKEIKTDRLPRHKSGDIMEVAVLRAIGRHDNIACFFSAYEVQHACFIVTEYVCGGALYDRVVAEDNLDEKISASIIRQMLLGLEHIQACSVLHLDLKPENVMMVAPSGYQLKIIDFGLAYFYDPKQPRRQMGGTYIYSAPETINYDYQSFATDIWSVGVIAYELLSGITPFECPQSGDPERELTLSEITTNILNCCYNFDDDGIRDTSDKAKDFIRTILKRNPKDRPSVEACLTHPWMEMSDELPTIRRAVSILRRASAKEKTQPFEIGQVCITTNPAVY